MLPESTILSRWKTELLGFSSKCSAERRSTRPRVGRSGRAMLSETSKGKSRGLAWSSAERWSTRPRVGPLGRALVARAAPFLLVPSGSVFLSLFPLLLSFLLLGSFFHPFPSLGLLVNLALMNPGT